MSRLKVFLGGYIVTFILLFLYSYTQVDLSLTLSRSSMYQTIEKGFQYVGYFNRPLSTELYVELLILLFGFYIALLVQLSNKTVARKHVWTLIIVASVLLAFSYNAFSYDFFNYIFDAKIFTHYHQNPYQRTALDFAVNHEPMLSFMHWTHRTYPYGPVWLVPTVLLSYLGGNIFIVTFFLFKIFTAGCYIVTAYFFEKILIILKKPYSLFNLAFFSLNPLVIIESLVSAHNDIVMIMCAVIGLYFFIQKKWVLALVFTIFSPLIKQATIFLPFVFVTLSLPQIKSKMTFERVFTIYSVTMTLAFLLYTVVGFIIPQKLAVNEIQPWYYLWIFPFTALLRPRFLFNTLLIGISAGMMLRYVPFLWQGDWNGTAIYVRLYVLLIIPFVFLLFATIWKTLKR